MSNNEDNKTFTERYGKTTKYTMEAWAEACKKLFTAKTKLEQIVKLTEAEVKGAEIDPNAEYFHNDTYELVFYCLTTDNGANVIVTSLDKIYDNKAVEYCFTKEYFLENFTKIETNRKRITVASIALG